MNIHEILPSLTNDAKRRDFVINHYREWDHIAHVPALRLEYYEITLTDGAKILALDYACTWKPGGLEVLYYDVPGGQLFSPQTMTANKAADKLMYCRQEMVQKP
jgi:hypothetical protein